VQEETFVDGFNNEGDLVFTAKRPRSGGGQSSETGIVRTKIRPIIVK
jgi:hypothetical protein